MMLMLIDLSCHRPVNPQFYAKYCRNLFEIDYLLHKSNFYILMKN